MMDTLSYHHRPGTDKYIYTTLPALMDSRAEQNPDDECHVFLDYVGENLPLSRTAMTYKDLSDRSMSVAAGLRQLGLKPGDRIGMYGRSIPEWLYIQYACFRLNILCVGIPVSLVYSENINTFVQDHRIKVLVLDPGHDAQVVEKVSQHIPGFKAAISGEMKDEASIYPSNILFLDDKVPYDKINTVAQMVKIQPSDEARDDILTIQKSIDPDDVALLFATSGSTGIPKLVMFSHFGFINFPDDDRDMSVDRMFCASHFAWMGGCQHMPVVSKIARIQLNPSPLDPKDHNRLILEVIAQERIISALLLTYMMHDIRNAISDGKAEFPECLHTIYTGGEKIPYDLVEFFDKMAVVGVGYGTSECTVGGVFNSRRDKFAVDSEGNATITYTPFASEIKIVDGVGKCVPRGLPGYIVGRQSYRFTGYLDDPEATAAALPRSGWSGPGDLAIMHDSGRIEILGRTTDLIIKGTIKIYPSKQEAMLLKHDKVAKAVVCGIPDPKFHEEICACVVPEAGCDVTEDELREHCAQYQPSGILVPLIPKYYLILNELPQTSTGKIDKKPIRAKFIEMAKAATSD